MRISEFWKDYECLDAGNGEKLERFGNVILRRPDPGAMWNVQDYTEWNSANAVYVRRDTGGGEWNKKINMPDSWNIQYKELTFKISLTNFKHTGIFPEQAINWDYEMEKIKTAGRKIKVLNLFAYTGGATIACSKAGAEVVHVDSSKGMVHWAQENAVLSKVDGNVIRYIVEDCLKFVNREIRRGNKYDAIIMDPPSFGRGPKGEVWKFEDSLYELINLCLQVLSDKPLFLLINSYTTGISHVVLNNILETTINKKYKGNVITGEIGLPIRRDKLILPCGIYGIWESK